MIKVYSEVRITCDYSDCDERFVLTNSSNRNSAKGAAEFNGWKIDKFHTMCPKHKEMAPTLPWSLEPFMGEEDE